MFRPHQMTCVLQRASQLATMQINKVLLLFPLFFWWSHSVCVTNPVHELTPTHHIVSCTSLQLHITHGLHFPSTIALVTQLSQSLISTHCLHPVPGLITCTGVPHSLPYLNSLHTHTHCEVLFCPGWHSEHYSCFCDLPVYDPGLFTPDCLAPLILCCLPLWCCSLKFRLCCCLPWLLPGIVYVSALPLIFLTLMVDHCLFDPV